MPQLAQNFACAASSAPQPVQNFFGCASGVPHSAQNFPPGCFVLHAEHVTITPPGLNCGAAGAYCCGGAPAWNCGWGANAPPICCAMFTPTAICIPAPAIPPSPTPCWAIPCPAPIIA